MRRLVCVSILTLIASLSVAAPQGVERIEIRPEAKPGPFPNRGETGIDLERRNRELNLVRCEFEGCAYRPTIHLDRRMLLDSSGALNLPKEDAHHLIDLSPDPPIKNHLRTPDQAKLFARASLDFKADSELRKFNREHPEIQSLRIEYRPGAQNRYAVYNGQLFPLHEGNDIGEIISRYCAELERGRTSVVIGLTGFNAKEGLAFATEISVQQELLDGSKAWSPVFGVTGDLLALYREGGARFEGMILDTGAGQQRGWWRARMRFTNGLRNLWVQMWFSSRQYLTEFVTAVFGTSSNPLASAQKMVERSKRQLLANHPELNEKQIYMGIRQEVRHSHLGEVLRRRREAA